MRVKWHDDTQNTMHTKHVPFEVPFETRTEIRLYAFSIVLRGVLVFVCVRVCVRCGVLGGYSRHWRAEKRARSEYNRTHHCTFELEHALHLIYTLVVITLAVK